MGRIRLSKKCRSGEPGARISRSAQRDKEQRHRASPTRIVSLYPYLTPEQRKLIEDAFMSNKYGYPADGHSPSIKSFENSLKQMKSADEHFLRTSMVLVVSSSLCPTTLV